MNIGLTYDLRDDYLAAGFGPEEVAEFDTEETIAGLEETLAGLGHRPERIGRLPRLVERLAEGKRWDLVFNIAEGVSGYGREAQVPGLLEAYGLPYTFSDPLTLTVTLHKGMAKRVVRDLGLPTPDFAVVSSIEEAPEIDLPFPLFAKPVAEGTGKGIGPASRLEDRTALVRACRDLLAAYRQPVLVETFLPGREFTVGIVGTGARAEAVGVMEVLLGPNAEPGVYSFVNKEESEQRVSYRLARRAEGREIAALALAVYRGFGCRDAGRVDIRLDGTGRPHFLEINPLAGLHLHHSDLPILCGLAGMSFSELIDRIVRSALQRAERERAWARPGTGPSRAALGAS
jgi:D-alanine-D-alanine ligase